ncbi:MAG: hypothetical protein ACXABY_17710 [Candidatus Thorarchaeota archaeon]|jgi:hypothetical protein
MKTFVIDVEMAFEVEAEDEEKAMDIFMEQPEGTFPRIHYHVVAAGEKEDD